MTLNVLNNQVGLIDPVTAYPDQGWAFSGNVATHSACNPGYIKKFNVELVVGKQYEVTYNVLAISSGYVKVLLGTASGANQTTAGIKTQVITCTANTTLQFYSDGNVSIEYIVIKEQPEEDLDNAVTVAFNEKRNYWSTRYSFVPEIMCKFIDNFIAFKDGQMWLQNKNELRNNFFGVQYPSKIKLYGNINPTAVKLWYGMRLKSNKVWYCPDNDSIVILPSEKKPGGMASRLKKKRFTPLHGDWFVDFMRNILDPRFEDIDTALRKGEQLMGNFIEINFVNEDNVEVVLFEIDIKSTPINYTY